MDFMSERCGCINLLFDLIQAFLGFGGVDRVAMEVETQRSDVDLHDGQSLQDAVRKVRKALATQGLICHRSHPFPIASRDRHSWFQSNRQ
jgi:hypothetical protein